MGLRHLALLAILFVLPGRTHAQKEVQEQLARYLERCAEHGWSGVLLVESRGKTLFHRGYGFADRANKREHGKGTLFEVASATKPFTACAVMALVEDEAIELDDPISKHLPGVPEDKQGITIHQLLAHTSGMPRSAAAGRGMDLERAVSAYLAPPAVRKPGEAHEYWNGGYALLAGIVAQASGKTYQEFCAERLFRPAGMKHTAFTGEKLPAKLLATGYSESQALRPANGHPYGEYGYQYLGMGGLVTSAEQLVQFMKALTAGEVLKKRSVKAMWTRESKHYGLGWGVTETKRNTRRISHGGDVAGFHTQWQFYPDEDTHVVVLSNVDGIPLFKLAWNAEAIVFGADPPYPQPPVAVKTKKKELDGLAATYVASDGSKLFVRREGEGLVVTAEGSLPNDLGGAYVRVEDGSFENFEWNAIWTNRLTFGKGKKPRTVEAIGPRGQRWSLDRKR